MAYQGRKQFLSTESPSARLWQENRRMQMQFDEHLSGHREEAR